MKSSERLQFKNARVLSEGERAGVDNETERVVDTLVLFLMESVSRAGKGDGWNIMGSPKKLRCNSRMLARDN
jgi:hypothetical protein